MMNQTVINKGMILMQACGVWRLVWPWSDPPQKPSEANWQSHLMVYYCLRDETSASFLFRRRRPLWEGRRRIGGDCSAVMNMPCWASSQRPNLFWNTYCFDSISLVICINGWIYFLQFLAWISFAINSWT